MSTTTRTVVCPHCQTKLRTAAAPEKRVSCPKCKSPFLPKTTVRTTAETKVVCSSCETKIQSVKPGAKFKCPKCGAIERAAPAAEPPPPAVNGKQSKAAPAAEPPLPSVNGKKPKAAPAAPAVKPVPAKKPVPKRLEPAPTAKIKKMPVVTNEKPAPPSKPKPVQAPPPKPTPTKASPPAPSSRPRRRNDDDEKSNWRISGKLLTTLIVLVLVGAIVGAWSLFGGDSGPDRAAVQGEVTIDGQPVGLGTIHFIPLDAKGRVIAMGAKKIENGKYQISREEGPSIGMCKVDIRVQRKTGRKLPSFMGAAPEDEIVEGAAERFNVKSELTFDVKAGSNTKTFEVSAR